LVKIWNAPIDLYQSNISRVPEYSSVIFVGLKVSLAEPLLIIFTVITQTTTITIIAPRPITIHFKRFGKKPDPPFFAGASPTPLSSRFNS